MPYIKDYKGKEVFVMYTPEEAERKRKIKEFICQDCKYQWTTRKSYGKPCKCPKCNSKNIQNELQKTENLKIS